ncbi:MAG TPA: hypothetical protein VF897_03120 [Roseiflexaceae bacterium]
MPFTYTNRRGEIYYLCQSTTRTGKPRYYFARSPKDAPVEQVPEGFRISESANGLVSIERDRPSQILPAEVAAVEAVIARHPKPRDYHVGVKRDRIEISERLGPDTDELARALGGSLGLLPGALDRLRNELETHGRFAPALRFCLLDAERRTFAIERWCSLGSIDDWIDVGQSGPLNRLVEPAVARLGDDSFYDPFWDACDLNEDKIL